MIIRIEASLNKSIGPTTYNPSYDLVKAKASTAASTFASSKLQRKNIIINKDIPGPGQYDCAVDIESAKSIFLLT